MAAVEEMNGPIVVRSALVGYVAGAVQAVEVAAGQRFRDFYYVWIAARADDPPYRTEELERAIAERRARVAVDDDGAIIGFAVGWTVDGEGHLDEVAVTPAHGRRGVGRAVGEVVVWAAGQRLGSVTLTTFRDVPWNCPYYEGLGFRIVETLSPALQSLLDEQAGWGLDPSLRVWSCVDPSPRTSPPPVDRDGPQRASRRCRYVQRATTTVSARP